MTDPPPNDHRFDALLIDTAPTRILAAGLRHTARQTAHDDRGNTAGLHALLGYNHGALLDTPAIRAHITPTGDGPIIRWADLGQAARTASTHGPDVSASETLRGLARLGTGLDVVLFACSLAANTPVPLQRITSRLSPANRRIMAGAFLLALAMPAAPKNRLDPGE